MKNKKIKKVKKSTPRTTTHEIVVKVQPITAPTLADVQPEKEGGKYMIPKTWMSEKQVVRMVQKTPAQHVYNRPAKGGGTWSYVTASYVEKVLNFTFGWNWDFEVVNHGREQDQVWVLGKLTVKDDHGHAITKTQFGRADVKYKKNSKDMLDYGNDLKAATSDALKKCASLLGIASDIYGKMEFKQEANVEIKTVAVVPHSPSSSERTIAGPDGEPVMLCKNCDSIISPQEGEYSKKMFGKTLCRACQEEAKKK